MRPQRKKPESNNPSGESKRSEVPKLEYLQAKLQWEQNPKTVRKIIWKHLSKGRSCLVSGLDFRDQEDLAAGISQTNIELHILAASEILAKVTNSVEYLPAVTAVWNGIYVTGFLRRSRSIVGAPTAERMVIRTCERATNQRVSSRLDDPDSTDVVGARTL